MRAGALLLALLGTSADGSVRAGNGGEKPCSRVEFVGEVRYGAAYVRRIGNGLEVYLQPIASGWILRVLPVGGESGGAASGGHDYAELATPPYNSVTPLSISTDFSFRAQDAVGWNPRRFRFAADGVAFARLAGVYGRLGGPGSVADRGVEQQVAEQVSQAARGSLTILDADLVPGTADQGRAAAVVASHFESTPHTVEEPGDGRPTALGRLNRLRFRVELDVPRSFRVEPGLKVERRACESPD